MGVEPSKCYSFQMQAHHIKRPMRSFYCFIQEIHPIVKMCTSYCWCLTNTHHNTLIPLFRASQAYDPTMFSDV